MNGRIARSVALSWALGAVLASGADAPPQRFHGEIEVNRVLVRVRVVEASGQPIVDLDPSDFEVTIDGRPVEVEAAEWIREGAIIPDRSPRGGRAPSERTSPQSEAPPPPGPRLVVLLFQTDFHRSRITGLMRIDQRAAKLVRAFGPGVRVAVAVFDSHLRLHCDFTDDHRAAAAGLHVRGVLADHGVVPAADEPSLVRHLDPERMRRAASIEAALEVLGEALAELPGAKEVLYFGWGAGRYDGRTGVVHLGPDYGRACDALARAHAQVFSVDLTDADAHSLELGMRQFAEDTGGLYLKTNRFPDVAMIHLAQVLSGHYELVVVPAVELSGLFEVHVRVRARGARVLAGRWQQAVQPRQLAR